MAQIQNPDSSNPPEWQPTASGKAELKLSMVLAGRVPALQMDFDFKNDGGFVVARRALSRAMPKEYAVHFRLRGRGAVNDLELKLLDAAGQNVWRYVKKDLRLPARWRRIRVESREIDFAWGPASGSAISQLGFIEFAIVARQGGKGTMWIADVDIEDCSAAQAPSASASSALPDFEAPKALVGPGWKPRPDDLRPWIVVDSLEPRTLGGLIIDWLGDAPASGFRIRGSNSGHRWKALHTALWAGGKRAYVYLPGLKIRFLRLQLDEPSAGAALRLQSFEFSRSIHAFWHNIADAEARGWHPRWLHREQSVWTPLGTSNGTHCALMNEDGMVEVGEGSFSIEPMLWTKERLFTWADVTARQELKEDWMPVPSSIWDTADWRLRIQAEATVSGAARVRYQFENLTDQALSARLFVLVRPFQVTPPWQSFRKLGGVSPIHDLAWREGGVRVNEITLIAPMGEPIGFGALCFDEGFVPAHLLAGRLPANTEAHDPFGFATGAFGFDLSLRPHQLCERVLTCTSLAAASSIADPAFEWGTRLPVTQWAGNGSITDAVRASLTATAHILVTRSGPALQPGPRRYTRSWIRDGAMMSAALLRMGHMDEVREFIRWYAPHQRADGFVPCCVDREGIDWLVEHDSHGQLLALIGDYYRFTSDEQFLAESWPFVDKAVGCIERLLGPDGLLPISVSHEGYLAQPVHSYWDDFWALRGLRDAADLARALRQETSAQRCEALAARLASSLFISIEATRAERKLDFIPGSIEWGDFDPTATANAIYLLDVPDGLDRTAVERTFDAYLADWRRKRSGAVASPSYTPYEIRIIGAFVRLGRRDAALELLQFFLSDRRPLPWNQWPEIAWRDRKAPAHIGDLPHTWIAAEYALAVRSLFAYEREADRSLVLAGGLASEWIEGSGVQVNGMPTLHGSLSYSLQRTAAQTLRFEIGGGITAKMILRPPLAGPLRSVIVDGSACTSFDQESVTILHTPAEVTCTSF
ncbi:MAG: discoidin domain-containing protein [Steroidobacteraceae bacterium]